jgi:hypothetical protein
MVLDVAHVVQQQLPVAEVEPIEPAAPANLLIRQRLDRRPALPAAMLEIGLKLGFRIRPLGKHPRGVQLRQRERRRGSEPLHRIGQVEIEIKERVIGHVPELGWSRGIPAAPDLVGTGGHGVLEHVDGGPELLPEDGSPGCVHFNLPLDKIR